MFVFGLDVPIWAVLVLLILFVVVAWKIIKFALKILVMILVFFVVLIGLDWLNVFDLLQKLVQNLLTSFFLSFFSCP